MKTKLFGLLLAIAVVFSSCETKPELEQLQSDLETKKIELSNLKIEIRDLEEKIKELDTTNSIKTIAVKTITAELKKFEHYFKINGSFEAVDYAYISPETSGQVTNVAVKEGQEVKKGQLLARLNTDIIENNISEVKTALDLASTVYDKQKELWNKNIGSEIEYLRAKNDKKRLEDQLKVLESQLEMSIIKSPINGIVDVVDIKVGELAMPGAVMMHIVNLDEFYLNVEVAETYLPYLHIGDPVMIKLPAYDQSEMQSEIYRIGNIINPENRSYIVSIKLKNENRIIKPNMLAEVQFVDFKSDNAIVVPSIIIKKDFKGYYLFKVITENGNQMAKKIYIEPGKSIEGTTMVNSGLEAGDSVIVQGYNQVVEGSYINIK